MGGVIEAGLKCLQGKGIRELDFSGKKAKRSFAVTPPPSSNMARRW